MEITSEYKSEIFYMASTMKDGESRRLEKDTQYDYKVKALKIIIDWGQDLKHGFSLTFNSDYTRIRKDNIA